jgi:hypothetical protein
VILSIGSGPGGRWFKSIRPNQLIPITSALSFAKTLRATEFHFLTMLQDCSQGVDLKVDRDFGEGQVAAFLLLGSACARTWGQKLQAQTISASVDTEGNAQTATAAIKGPARITCTNATNGGGGRPKQ